MPLGKQPIQSKYFSYIFCEHEELSDLKIQQELDSKFYYAINAINENYNKTKDQFIAIKSINPIVNSINENCKNSYDKLRDIKIELLQELEKLIDATKEQKLCNKLLSLINFMDYYWYIVDYKKEEPLKMLIENLECTNCVVDKIKTALRPNGYFTKNMLFILKQKIEYLKNFTKFEIIYCALKTFVAALFFMFKQYAFLAEYYFQQGDISKFNSCLQSLALCFKDFQQQLLDNTQARNIGLITKLRNLALELHKLDKVKTEIQHFTLITKSLELLNFYKHILQEIKLPFNLEQPAVLKYKPNFQSSKLQTPIGPWRNGKMVSYAVQYENYGIYTKLTPWTPPFLVTKQANPKIYLSHKPTKQQKILVYRKFDLKHKKPVLVAIIDDEQQTSFQDLTRDLFNAAGNTNEELAYKEFKIYLKNGADITAILENNNTIWHVAAQAGNVRIAESFLLNNKQLNINALNMDNKTALDIAAEYEHRSFVNLLKANGAILNVNSNWELHSAAFQNQVLRAELLIEQNAAHLCKYDSNGFTPFHCATFGGVEIIKSLLKYTQLHVNARTKAGLSALHLAILNANIDVLKLLLACKEIDINAPCNAGLRPLHFAVMLHDLEMTELTLNHEQIDINATAYNGWTALHIAVARNAKRIIMTLLKSKGINVNAMLTRNITPLHLAVVTKSKNTIELLLKNGAAVNAQTKEGLTASNIAAKFNNLNTLNMLIEYGAEK